MPPHPPPPRPRPPEPVREPWPQLRSTPNGKAGGADDEFGGVPFLPKVSARVMKRFTSPEGATGEVVVESVFSTIRERAYLLEAAYAMPSGSPGSPPSPNSCSNSAALLQQHLAAAPQPQTRPRSCDAVASHASPHSPPSATRAQITAPPPWPRHQPMTSDKPAEAEEERRRNRAWYEVLAEDLFGAR